MSQKVVDYKEGLDHRTNLINKSTPISEVSGENTYSQVNIMESVTDVDEFRLATKSGIKYRQYPQRWVVFLTFCLTIMINGMPYETCIPIGSKLISIYGVSDSLIAATATTYIFMHPLFTFFASAVIVKKGFGTSVKIGCFCTIVGIAIRLLVNFSFYFVLVGQIICGIGRPFILNGQASMAQNWFFPKSRTMILTIANSLLTISIVLSLQIPAILFKKYKFEGNLESKDKGEQLTFQLMLYELIGCILIVPTFFLLKTSPPTPPSGFAQSDIQVPFKETMKGIFTNRSFIITFITNSLYFGTLKGLLIVIPYLMEPFEFKETDYANAGTMAIIGGLISSIFISTIVQKVGKYKPVSLMLMFLTIITFAAFYFAVESKKINLVYIDTFIVGFFLIPLVPVMLELSCEAIYPLNGSFAVGMLLSGATLFTVIMGQILTIITKGTKADEESSRNGYLSILGLLIFGLVLQVFVREQKNRTNEINSRKVSSTIFFKPSIYTPDEGLTGSKHGKFQQSIIQSVGDYPTYHPFVDFHQFVSDPDQLNPDTVKSIHQSVTRSMC